MNKAGIYHHCGDTWCHALGEHTLHIRIRTAANDIDGIDLVSGDPFEWGVLGSVGIELDKSDSQNAERMVWKSGISPMEKSGSNGIHDFWEIRIKPPYKRLKYWFLIHDGKKTYEFGEKGLVEKVDRWNTWNTFIFPYIHEKEIFRAPQWVGKTIWYQIFPERYRNGNPALNPEGTELWQNGPVTNRQFYGGDLPGITASLDHIAETGFTGIYLTPIFASPSVHKYDTTDYLRIDPAFGTDDDLRILVGECHKRGLRIILDAVFNHCGTQFAPWLDVLENGEKSRFKDRFVIDRFPLFGDRARTETQNGARNGDRAEMIEMLDTGDSHHVNFHTFAFTTGMPKLNTSNPETRDYLLNVAERYIREFDIDGWRLDVANEVDHEFWQMFRKRVKAVKPDAYIVGEIWHNSMSWLRGDQYDAIMNYHFGQAICNFLSRSTEIPDGRALANRMTTLEFSYPEPVIRAGFNLLDSHDTERLISRLGGSVKAARQAWLMLALLPGAPCFYYGSEFGLSGGGDPDCRRCMPWAKENQLPGQHEFFKEILALRKRYLPLVNGGKRTWLWSKKEPGLFGFRIEAGTELEMGTELKDAPQLKSGTELGTITVLFNRSSKPVTIARYAAILTQRERQQKAFARIEADGFTWAVMPH